MGGLDEKDTGTDMLTLMIDDVSVMQVKSTEIFKGVDSKLIQIICFVFRILISWK